VVTALFLRPIFKVLCEVGGVRSEGHISLQKTKWLTLLGASLAVLSSTALYINTGLYVLLGGPGKTFNANPYLNMFVFGINLDSILNDVGMLLACGVIKKIMCETATVRLSTAKSYKVDPAAPPVFNNKAPEEDASSEADDMMVLGQSNERDLQSFPNTGAGTSTVPIHHTTLEPSSAFPNSLPDRNIHGNAYE
jgi:hypothetical protein